jgi:hypothetical protein
MPVAGASGRRAALVLATAALAFLAAFTQVRTFPYDATVGVDSGVFAYGGEQVLQGKLPYRDFWDHKPPAVFYLDALSIALLGPTANGLWLFGTAYVVLVTLAMAWALKTPLGAGPGFLAAGVTVLTLTHPNYFRYANFTEVYALLPQVLTFAAASAITRKPSGPGMVVLGLITSICFLVRQTSVGLGLAMLLAALLEPGSGTFLKRVGARGTAFAAGFIAPILLVGGYWARQGALSDLWSAVIEFNRLYAAILPSPKAIYATLRFMLMSQPLASVVAFALVAATLWTFARFRPAFLHSASEPGDAEQIWITESHHAEHRLLLNATILALPLEVYVLAIGKGYEHYYITAIPAFALAATFLFTETLRQIRNHFDLRYWSILGLTAVLCLGIPWVIETYSQVRPALGRVPRLASEWSENSSKLAPEVEYVIRNTSPAQSVLFWGYQTKDSFAAGRRSPTRYTYPAALLMPGYDNSRRWREFLDDLERDPPTLILGNRDWYPYFIPSEIGVCADCVPAIRQGMEAFNAYVLAHYKPAGEINGLQVFRRTPG